MLYRMVINVKKRIKKLFAVLLTVISLWALGIPAFAAENGSTAGTVRITSGSLNVRAGASTSSAVIASLYKGETVTLLQKSGNFWKVEYGSGQYGYASADYIAPVSGSYAARVQTAGGNLNVRAGAGTSYAVRTALPNGKIVVVLSQSGGWAKILYNGKSTGYVSSTYLRAAGSNPSSGYSAVKLSVVSYKQTDSRWANVRLGTSGDTIGTSGCATTALAMTESYRTGTTVTPAAMASRLTYAPAGWLYWPSNYVISTDSAGYLQTVYNLLKSGKPVILGMAKANGAQHWVVVTGFTGGALTAGNFTINDPGSNSRTTLNTFVSVYPNFYKMVYYK